MTAIQLRTEVLREMEPLLENEPAMIKLLAVIKNLRMTHLYVSEMGATKTAPQTRKWSARVKWLREHPVKLTEEDLMDERTQYLLNN